MKTLSIFFAATEGLLLLALVYFYWRDASFVATSDTDNWEGAGYAMMTDTVLHLMFYVAVAAALIAALVWTTRRVRRKMSTR
jgi:hypothetical protein